MKFLSVVLLATSALGRHPDLDHRGIPVSRIVNGEVVNPKGKYPFMVRAPLCGASLIAPEWVLTAAHCIGKDGDIGGPLWLGLHNTSELEEGTQVKIVQTIVHPDYGQAVNDTDIALYKISPAILSHQPIALDSGRGKFSIPGVENTVIGWGRLSENGPAATVLQELTLPVVSNAVCAEVLNIDDREICMGTPKGGKDACSGDSGGPMFYQDDGKFVQTGVVSWGVGCARPNLYGVYARVSEVVEWIQEYAKDIIVVPRR